jgi:dTDP-glucose 4,6-dehydratase
MLEIARSKKAVFLLTSTSEVYGDPKEHPQKETYWGHVNPIGPRSVYDEAKRYAEAITFAYRRTYKVDTRVVRIFNTYGPRMNINDGRVVPNFIDQALKGKPVTVYGDGSQSRSFCYVSDEAEGILKLLFSKEPGPVNIGNPVEFTMNEFAKIVVELTGSKSRIVYKSLPQDDPKQRKPDITLARTKLGWEPKVPLREGLKMTINWFRANPH